MVDNLFVMLQLNIPYRMLQGRHLTKWMEKRLIILLRRAECEIKIRISLLMFNYILYKFIVVLKTA